MRQICEINKAPSIINRKSTPLKIANGNTAVSCGVSDLWIISALLLRQGYTVGYKRVSRLMKEENLSVSVKRVCQTTRSSNPWVNRVQTLEISREDQVWVGILPTSVSREMLMDIFTRMIRGWQVIHLIHL